MNEAVKAEIESFLDNQGVDLTEEQKQRVLNGVLFWLGCNLSEAIADSVQNVL